MNENMHLTDSPKFRLGINFWEENRNEILDNRERFFQYLKSNGVTNTLINSIKLHISDRDKKSNGKLLGESFPLILREIANVSNDKFEELNLNWLAIYSSITMIDNQLDDNSNASDQVSSSIASQVSGTLGILNLFKVVSGTKYEKLFYDAIVRSANGQLLDITNQSNSSKEFSAKEKNRLLLGLAGAMAATVEEDEKKAQFIIDFSTKLLLTVQLIDDITDFEADYYSKNYTYLLNLGEENLDGLSSDQLLLKLIQNGSLRKTLERVKEGLREALDFATDFSLVDSQSNSILLFKDLSLKVNTLIESIENLDGINSLSKSYLNNIKKLIEDIALAS